MALTARAAAGGAAVVLALAMAACSDEATAPGTGIGHEPISATYEFLACGELQSPSPEWHSGVHTHGNGDIHIHPFTPSEEGPGSRLVKWFEYGAGELTRESIRIPGQSRTWSNGDACPDGGEGRVQLFVNDSSLEDWSEYIPAEGDQIRLVFGPAAD